MWTSLFRCRDDIENCLSRNPALFFGISLFAGVWLTFSSLQMEKFFFLLLLPLLSLRRASVAVLLIGASFISTSLRVINPPSSIVSQGTLLAEVTDRHLVTIHGKTSWKISFFVHEFRSDRGEVLAKGITLNAHSPLPCAVFGGTIYRIKGTFLIDPSMQARFRPVWSTLFEEGRTFSFVETRIRLRTWLEKLFVTLFTRADERVIAGALTFGLYKDPFTQHLMHRAGVEHVLAISGFHFGIIAALTLLLASQIRPRVRSIIAFFLLTFYLLIIGPLPAVMRSWWASSVLLLGIFLGKKSSGLNCFGIGLIAASLIDPFSLTQIGCQLSFLATGAILLFSRYTLTLCSLLIRPKSVNEFVSFSAIDQVLAIILHRIFPAFSLIIPVWAVILPYQLAFMPDISLLGVLYNLCIPLLFSLAMPCILLAVLTFPLPLLSKAFVFLGSLPLRSGILLMQAAPESSLASWQVAHISPSLASIIIAAVFLCGCILEGHFAPQHTDSWKACV